MKLVMFLSLVIPMTTQSGLLTKEAQKSIHIQGIDNILSKHKVSIKGLSVAINELGDKYKVSEEIILKVMLHESKGNPNAKSHTHDYGLMQVNRVNGNLKCLTNWRCNLEVGVKYLSKVKRLGQYNAGHCIKNGRVRKVCLRYEEKVGRIKL